MKRYQKMIMVPCLVLCLMLLIGCHKRIQIIPDDRELRPVVGEPDRVSISKGYLREIYIKLEKCK